MIQGERARRLGGGLYAEGSNPHPATEFSPLKFNDFGGLVIPGAGTTFVEGRPTRQPAFGGSRSKRHPALPH